MGESGSGKSMSALAIAGLLSRRDMHKRGQILFDGLDLLTCERSKLRKIQGNEISMIFQEPMTSLNPVKRIGWQIEESLRIHTELNKEERYQKAIEMMKEVELPDPERLYRQYPHELSGGMRQRVMIAIALACNPKILIADEPTTALDVTIQAQILNLLKDLQKELHLTYIFIAHGLPTVQYISDRIAVMYMGKLMELAPEQELFAHTLHPYTEGLLSAIPVADPEARDAQNKPILEGDLPSPLHLPQGCRFCSRCKYARDVCTRQEPELHEVLPGHYAACHFPLAER